MKKVIAALLAAALLAGTLAGCGGRKVTALICADEQERQVYTDLAARYQESTGVQVELQFADAGGYEESLAAFGKGRRLPDIFCAAPGEIARYVAEGRILPLDGYLTGDVTEDIWPAVREAFTAGAGEERSLYALPMSVSVYALAYNRDLFDVIEEPYPDPEKPYTWLEFAAVCQRLTQDTDKDGAVDQWGCDFDIADDLDRFVYTNNATFLSGDGREANITSPEFLESFQFFTDLTCKYRVCQTLDRQGGYRLWKEGRLGFFALGTRELEEMLGEDGPDIGWGICGWPTGASGVSMAELETVGFAVSKSAKDPQACADLIKLFSTDPQGQEELRAGGFRVPNAASLVGDLSDWAGEGAPENGGIIIRCLQGAGGFGTYVPEREYGTGWWDAFLEGGCQDIYTGGITAPDYCEAVRPAVQSALDGQ